MDNEINKEKNTCTAGQTEKDNNSFSLANCFIEAARYYSTIYFCTFGSRPLRLCDFHPKPFKSHFPVPN